MLPVGHVAVGYLAYSTWRRVRSGRGPTAGETAVLVFATQFPDVVDKPLAAVGVLAYGRSLAHSLVTLSMLVLVLEEVTVRVGKRWIVSPFAVGTVSHSVADAVPALITRGITQRGASHLFWPVTLPIPEYSFLWVPGASFLRAVFSARPESGLLIVAAAVLMVVDFRTEIRRLWIHGR